MATRTPHWDSGFAHCAPKPLISHHNAAPAASPLAWHRNIAHWLIFCCIEHMEDFGRCITCVAAAPVRITRIAAAPLLWPLTLLGRLLHPHTAPTWRRAVRAARRHTDRQDAAARHDAPRAPKLPYILIYDIFRVIGWAYDRSWEQVRGIWAQRTRDILTAAIFAAARKCLVPRCLARWLAALLKLVLAPIPDWALAGTVAVWLKPIMMGYTVRTQLRAALSAEGETLQPQAVDTAAGHQ